MKEIFVVASNSEAAKTKILEALNKEHMPGFVLPTINLKQSRLSSDVEPLPEFGVFRHLISHETDTTSLVMLLIDVTEREEVKKIIRNALSDMDTMPSGTMFSFAAETYEELAI